MELCAFLLVRNSFYTFSSVSILCAATYLPYPPMYQNSYIPNESSGIRSFSVGEKRLRIRPIKKNARSILLLLYIEDTCISIAHIRIRVYTHHERSNYAYFSRTNRKFNATFTFIRSRKGIGQELRLIFMYTKSSSESKFYIQYKYRSFLC